MVWPELVWDGHVLVMCWSCDSHLAGFWDEVAALDLSVF